MPIKVFYKLETSNHDGYCSGDECEYTESDKTYVLSDHDLSDFCGHDLDKVLLDYNNGNRADMNADIYQALVKIEQQLPQPDVGGGSSYCGLSKECKQKNLDRHDYRITIIDMEEEDD